MFLIEHDGKALLQRQGIAVPDGVLLPPDRALSPRPDWPRVAVKAQLPSGGRGRRGLVRVVDVAEADAACAAVRAAMPPEGGGWLRVEQAPALQAEWYMACRVDDVAQAVVWSFTTAGGVDVEQAADSLQQVFIDPLRSAYPQDLIASLRRAGVPPAQLAPCARLGAALCRALVSEDATLIEINPLGVLADGRLLALDAKVDLDDSAARRHEGWSQCVSSQLAAQDQSALERRAAQRGIQFVDMPGDIAVLTGGAGQGMLLADLVQARGWRPANFTDASGGGSAQTVRDLVELVFERARREDVRGILAYFITSATPIERVVAGLIDALRHCRPPKPMVLGLTASGGALSSMSVAQAHRALAAEGVRCCHTPYEALDELQALLRP